MTVDKEMSALDGNLRYRGARGTTTACNIFLRLVVPREISGQSCLPLRIMYSSIMVANTHSHNSRGNTQMIEIKCAIRTAIYISILFNLE